MCHQQESLSFKHASKGPEITSCHAVPCANMSTGRMAGIVYVNGGTRKHPNWGPKKRTQDERGTIAPEGVCIQCLALMLRLCVRQGKKHRVYIHVLPACLHHWRVSTEEAQDSGYQNPRRQSRILVNSALQTSSNPV